MVRSKSGFIACDKRASGALLDAIEGKVVQGTKGLDNERSWYFLKVVI